MTTKEELMEMFEEALETKLMPPREYSEHIAEFKSIVDKFEDECVEAYESGARVDYRFRVLKSAGVAAVDELAIRMQKDRIYKMTNEEFDEYHRERAELRALVIEQIREENSNDN